MSKKYKTNENGEKVLRRQPVFVLHEDGTPLMPTTRNNKVSKWLETGEAVVVKHHPFTVQLTRPSKKYTQPLEICVDSGTRHVGISVKSEKQEFVSEQRDLLTDQKERLEARRKYRRTRRNRLRHRKPRFNNRKTPEIMPSVKNKADTQIRLIEKYANVLPNPKIIIEVGQFDTHLLKKLKKGEKVPVGTDYQRGEQYGYESKRLAVFARDDYTCQACFGKSKDQHLRLHHVHYTEKDHGDTIDDLITICATCHTAANHETILKDLKGPREFHLSDATQMNQLGKYIPNALRSKGYEIETTYGAFTNMVRKELGLEKSHVNDAYAIGNFHPPIRAPFRHLQKERRQSRSLTKFYDATYYDKRDGKIKKGAELSCGRTSRSVSRHDPKLNMRVYRASKKTKGRVTAPKKKYDIRPGDIIEYDGKLYCCYGVQNKGKSVVLDRVNGHTVAVSVRKVRVVYHCNGWSRAQRGYIRDVS